MSSAFTYATRAFGLSTRSLLRQSVNANSICRRTTCQPQLVHFSRTRMMSDEAGSGTTADDTVMSSVKTKISEALNPTRLEVTPTYGDPNGSHVSITVVSDAFEGLNVVKRHRVVYKAIWEELSGPIHAVDELVTKTPAEDQS